MSRKDAAGRPASARPVRPRRTAVETASTAACWPMMRSESVWRRDSSRSRSDCRSLPTGMPVRSETTAAMSCRSGSRCAGRGGRQAGGARACAARRAASPPAHTARLPQPAQAAARAAAGALRPPPAPARRARRAPRPRRAGRAPCPAGSDLSDSGLKNRRRPQWPPA